MGRKQEANLALAFLVCLLRVYVVSYFAVVTVFLIVVAILVIWEESSIYFKPITEDFMMVDTDLTEKLIINMDISFYKLRCSGTYYISGR